MKRSFLTSVALAPGAAALLGLSAGCAGGPGAAWTGAPGAGRGGAGAPPRAPAHGLQPFGPAAGSAAAVAAAAPGAAGVVARGQPRPPAPPAPAPFSSLADATRLQVFLDDEDFGPGKIDGRNGEFTRKALLLYGQAHGLGALRISAGLDEQLPALRRVRPFAVCTVAAADAAQIGQIPADRAAQGKRPDLPYTSLLELLAERYHAEQAYLRRLNPGKKLDALQVGDTIQVPNVQAPLDVSRLAQHGHLLPVRPEFQPRVVRVDTKTKMLDVTEDGRLLACFPITPGSSTLPAPPGTWKIVNVASMPYFRYDEAMLNHGVRSDQFVQLPPGPNSPVGVMWMGLNKTGIGLHGTNNPETIGRAASHGCIRLANWDAVKLAAYVSVGTTVKID